MAERVTRIRAQAFRSVPEDFALDLTEGRSVVVCGDNGTGKSTVADALELYFTGRIAFLAREGRQGSVRHIGAGGNVPTAVAVETTGSLAGEATIESAGNLEARSVGRRETFLLRGRTLAEFIEKPKADKWKYVFEILGMGDVEQFRLDLQNASNALSGEAERAAELLGNVTRALAPLAGADVNEESVLTTFRTTCGRAGVSAPSSLESAIDPDWTRAFSERQKGIQAAAKLRALESDIQALDPVPSINVVTGWNALVDSLGSRQVTRLHLFQSAVALVEREPELDRCPLCEQPVSTAEFLEHVRNTLRELADAAASMQNGRRLLERFAGRMRGIQDARARARANAGRLGIDFPQAPQAPLGGLDEARTRGAGIDPADLEAYAAQLAAWDRGALEALRAKMPRTDPRDEALVRIGQLVEQSKTWITARTNARRAETAARTARRLCDAYTAAQNRYFVAVLERISKRLAQIYGRLHPEEGLTKARVETSGDKGLELAMDFHASPQKPPHGVLSESHLNSLAIALFLAMAETFNERLRFLVLDDVVNSFDVEHRGALAELLTEEYEDWQLIVLTHDPVFYQQLARRNPGWIKHEMTSCTFEEGPRFLSYRTGSLLEKAEKRLADGDANGAATKGRRALEEVLQEACEGLLAPLPFRRGRRNDHRDVAELTAGIRRLHKHSIRMPAALDKLLRDLEAHAQAALNVESHASPWHASVPEVRAALRAIAELNDFWTCGECRTRVWARGDAPGWRCHCGSTPYPESRLPKPERSPGAPASA